MGVRKHYTNKASGGDGMPAELFLILKDDAVKVLHSVFWPGEFQGMCSPWGHKKLDTTERLSLSL